MSGRVPRLLMCRPDHFGIEYEINPWMDRRRASDPDAAKRQWDALVAIFERLGVTIELLAPVSGLPDLVFTANAGVVWNDVFVPSRFRHVERQGESPHFERWFTEHGFRAVSVESGDFEGAGDALFCGETLYAGYLRRSELQAHHELAALFGCHVLGLELVDPRFYHLDTCFCPLAPGIALAYLPAFDEYGVRVLREHIDTLIEAPDDDAARFACNAVVIGDDVVLNTGCGATERLLCSHGFVTHSTDLSEFLKAGGAAKCLTLRLDGEEAADWASAAGRD